MAEIDHAIDYPDISEVFKSYIFDKLVPLIEIIFDMFADYDIDSRDGWQSPTRHLSLALKSPDTLVLLRDFQIEPLTNQHGDTLYLIGTPVDNWGVFFGSWHTEIRIIILEYTRTAPNKINVVDGASNNIGASFERNLNMLAYGVKANANAPRVSGTIFNQTMVAILTAMRVQKLFIRDSAFVPCIWDESIPIEHFSILRIIAGKPTFYETTFLGQFMDPAAAELEKEVIRNMTSEEDKAFIGRYMADLRSSRKTGNSGDCVRIREIIERTIRKLVDFKVCRNKDCLAISRFVATPYIPPTSRGGRARRRKTYRNRKRTKRASKTTHRSIRKHTRRYWLYH